MRISRSLKDKLDGRLTPQITIPDIHLETILESRLAPNAFADQRELLLHLVEGSMLGVTTLASHYLGIPGGSYVVYNTNEKSTALFPLEREVDDLVEEADATDIHTSKLLDNWDLLRKNLVENNRPVDHSAGNKERVQKHTSKYARNPQVKGAIEASGHSQEEIADICNVDPSTVSRWTAKSGEGARLPSLSKAITFAKSAGLDVEDMFSSIAASDTKQKKTSGSGGGRNRTYRQGNAP